MRPLLIALCLALSSCALAQRLPLPEGYPADGETKTTDILLGLGSGVEVSYNYTREDDVLVPLFSCVRECEGKKHPRHDACDLSCDKACPARQSSGPPHRAHFDGSTTEIGANDTNPPPRPHSEGIERDYAAFNFPSTWRANTFLARLLQQLKRTKNYFDPLFRADHWIETPCSTSTKSVKSASYVVTVQYTLYDVDGQKVTRGPSGTIRYRVLIPFRNEIVTGQPEVNCRCEVKQSGPEDGHGFLPGGTGEHYAFIDEEGTKRPLTGTDVAALVTSVSVQDMNYATLSYTSPWKGDLFIPAGWEFECTEGGGQGVQIADDLFFATEVGSGQIRVRIGGWTPELQSKRLRVFCTEINKPEPSPTMIYRLVPPRNALLQRAAQIARASNFRGPWDQMRLWIATDQSTYKQVEDKLFPAPSGSQYVSALRDLARVGAIDPYDSRYLRLMEPRLIFTPRQDLAAVEWMVRTRAISDATAIAAELRKLSREVAAFMVEPEAMAVVGLVASTLATHGGDEGALTAIWLVDVAVPETRRKEIAELSHGIALALETTKDAKVAAAVLDWVAKHRPVSATAGLVAVSPSLPTEIRERALALAKEIHP